MEAITATTIAFTQDEMEIIRTIMQPVFMADKHGHPEGKIAEAFIDATFDCEEMKTREWRK